VLGIIAEFYDVEMTVGSFYQTRLRAAAHFPDHAAGVYWHLENMVS